MSSVVVNRNLKTLHEALNLTPSAVNDATVVVDSVYREQEKQLWATEGASGGAPWTPLSPKYLAWKEGQRSAGRIENRKLIAKFRSGNNKVLKSRLLMSTRILVQFGGMREAFSMQADHHVAEGFILPTGAKVQVGASGPAFYRFHAEGGSIPGRPPKRDPQQRTQAGDAALVDGVRRSLVPHVVRTIRDMLRTGAPRPGGVGA